MKKIFILLFFALISINGFSQYKYTSSFGSHSTFGHAKSAGKGGHSKGTSKTTHSIFSHSTSSKKVGHSFGKQSKGNAYLAMKYSKHSGNTSSKSNNSYGSSNSFGSSNTKTNTYGSSKSSKPGLSFSSQNKKTSSSMSSFGTH